MPTTSLERDTGAALAEAAFEPALEPGLLLLGPGREPVFASPAARELLGAAAATDDAGLAAPLAALLAPLDERLRSLEPGGEPAEAAVEVPVAGGARRLLVTAYPVVAGGAASVVLLLRDAALLDRVGEDLRLAAHMRAVAEITPAVAHDLRAPINSMVFNLEVLKETLAGPLAAEAAARERQARYVRVLRDELSRLHKGLEVWLAQTAERTHQPEACDLRDLLGELAALLVPPARKRQVQIAWEPPAAPIIVSARRYALKQALLLFGLAALEAAPNGTSLALALATGNGRTFATIRSGPSGEAREARFQLQITPDASRTRLHVARLLVAESGGEARVLGAPTGAPAGFELQWPDRGQGEAMRSPE